MRTAAWLGLVTVAVAAAIAANYLLLGFGRQEHDPVGRLTPRLAAEIAGRGIVTAKPAPSKEHDQTERDGDEDD